MLTRDAHAQFVPHYLADEPTEIDTRLESRDACDAHRLGAGTGVANPVTASPTVNTNNSGSGDLPQGAEEVDLDPADFTTEIDNPYLPMKPGTHRTAR